MITSPHFHVRKIFMTLMLAVYLPASIEACHAAEEVSADTANSPSRRFVCPIKCPKIKWSELSWPRFSCSHKIGTDTSDENVDSDVPAFALTDKFQTVQEATCDNSPEVIMTLKPSGSKTEESEYGDSATSLNFTGKSESFKKLESYTTVSSVEHKKGPLYDPAPHLRLKVRQMYEKVRIILPEDNINQKEKNEACFGKLSKSNYEIEYPLTGSDAFSAAIESGFYYDCVITDLQMESPYVRSPDMLKYAISYATKYKAQHGIDLSDIIEMPAGIILAAAFREIEYTGPIIAVTSDYQEINTEGKPLNKYRHLFQDARFKIQKYDKLDALLKKHNVRSRHSIRMPDILSSFSKKSPKHSEASKSQKIDN